MIREFFKKSRFSIATVFKVVEELNYKANVVTRNFSLENILCQVFIPYNNFYKVFNLFHAN